MDRGVAAVAPRVRLVALDIDGTLLRSDRTLSPRTRGAVERARAAGVRVVLVTGRRHPSARRVAEELGEPLPLVLHNGALVVEGGRIVLCRPLGRVPAERAIRAGRAAGQEPVVHCGRQGEGWLIVERQARPAGLVAYYLERAQDDVREVDDVIAALVAEEPIQVMFGGPRSEMEALAPVLEAALTGVARIERTVYAATDLSLLDVLHPAVGKQAALGFLQGRWAISPAETLAIGDNWNDRAMVEAAGRGFVMGNADPQLLALGLPVLPTNDEDGVAQAIEAHVLAVAP
jgi:Cof subfamily protein (haloacid dehalogenase superfamily)